MKKAKILSSIMALSMMAAAVTSMPSFAQKDVFYTDELNEMTAPYGDEAIVIPIEESFEYGYTPCTDYNVILTKDSASVLAVYSPISFKVKEGTELPDKIGKMKIAKSMYYENQYHCPTVNLSENEGLVEEIKKLDGVVSIDKKTCSYELNKISCKGIYFETDLTPEEVMERYPSLNLQEIEFNRENCAYKDCDFFLGFEENISQCHGGFGKNYNEDMYNDIMKLSEDKDIYGYHIMFGFLEQPCDMPDDDDADEWTYENLYTAPIEGDVNADGEIGISDVVAITAYVGSPEENLIPVEQRRINGDVHNTGDGLTANDALLIQQYLAGDIESF